MAKQTVPEEWRAVVGWEGFYEVSNHGRVKSVERIVYKRNRWGNVAANRMREKILKQAMTTSGYPFVGLCRHSKPSPQMIHRLVATAFHRLPMADEECLHRDGNRLNNCAENLRWGTHKENQQDMVAHGRSTPGTRNANCKLTDEAVRAIRASVGTCKAVGQLFNIAASQVCLIRNGKAWAHLR
jgi:hypothetical protein